MYRGLPLISSRGRMVGEIDLLGVHAGGVDVFEVKCSFRPVKARKQLQKISKLFNDKQVKTWFYCGEAAQLMKI